MENVSLIDVSFEDDLLIPSSSQGFGTHTILETENVEKASMKLEQSPKPSDSPDQDQKRYRHHLRKSLAWDSAFFTSEGILNSEELAIMNSTYCKSGITLPGIQEELRKSSESTSTLESDSRALEQLEVNLFENVRVSIQKTLGGSNCSRMMVHCDKVKEEKKSDARNCRSLEKAVVSSKIKSKTPIASRRHFVSTQQKEHTSKDRLVCVSMPSLANGESKPLIKPTKVSCKTILPPSVPRKKASTEIIEIKRNPVKPLPAAKQQSTVAFNKSIEAPGITRGMAVSTKSKTPKSSRIGYTSPIFTRSSLVHSKASPTSSVDSVVSASSSSTTSASINLGKSFEGSDAGSLSPPLSLSSSVGTYKYSGSLSRSCIYDRTKSDVNGDSGSRLAKPSGLRIPRPTVGYFDKEKCLVRGSSKAPKPSLLSNAPRNTGVNHITTANKMRPSELPTLRDRALPKQALKSAEAHGILPTRIKNLPEPCPKVNISSEKATNIREMDSKDKEASIHNVPRDQKGQHQSYRTHVPEENVKNDINVADRETERAIH